ncbi:hypothetical protein [Pedobacter agri]|uniref:hypothetical protein n=1 Tax=Pedobacter agri TaxID=454586 RepID=UPI00293078F3|nr:hypothetical protein [Pedobacter agri]
MQKILIVSSGQPSLNPRLVKEADTLVDAGFEVIIIYQYWNDWGTELDKKLLSNRKWKAIRVGGSPNKQKLIYFITKLNFRFFNLLAFKFSYNFKISERAIGRSSILLLKKASKIKADLYIAHNLGALPAAINAAKKNKAKCGFDAEDFHRQEVTDDTDSKAYRLAKYIEDKYFPKLDYLTTASPLIAKAYQKIYPNLKPTVINNVFSADFLQKVRDNGLNNELKLFWFSQTIGKNRGIEDAIKAIGYLKKGHICLTLLGNIDQEHKLYFSNLALQYHLLENQIIFIKPTAPDKIFNMANQHDIGLALEPAFCLNNNIALSNKVFTYLTSGLSLIASETTAQKKFILSNPDIGQSYPIGNINDLATIIRMYDEDRNLLYKTKLAASNLAKEQLNWEMESKKFIELIEKTISD